MISMQPYLLKTKKLVSDAFVSVAGDVTLGQSCQNFEGKIGKPVYGHQPVLRSLIKHVFSGYYSACFMENLLKNIYK